MLITRLKFLTNRLKTCKDSLFKRVQNFQHKCANNLIHDLAEKKVQHFAKTPKMNSFFHVPSEETSSKWKKRTDEVDRKRKKGKEASMKLKP